MEWNVWNSTVEQLRTCWED